MKVSLRDKFAGTLLGLAIGDALGQPYEGVSSEEMKKIPEEELKIFHAGWLGEGKYTDDTLMAICLAEAIISAKRVDPEVIAELYGEWFLSGDLRGIGMTVSKALSKYVKTRDWRTCGVSGKWAAGNGAAMRVAPIALFDFNMPIEVLYRDVEKDAVITHRNQEAINGAFAVALAIRWCLHANEESRRRDIFDFVLKGLSAMNIENLVVEKIEFASKLLSNETDPLEALDVLGTSGYVVETVSSALFCFARASTYIDSVVMAIKGGGDTDTIAAITGAISGAYYGANGIPKELRERVEKSSYLEELAVKIYELAVSRRSA